MLKANKNKKMCLKESKGEKVTYFLVCIFVLFMHAKKREKKKIEKVEKFPQCNVLGSLSMQM